MAIGKMLWFKGVIKQFLKSYVQLSEVLSHVNCCSTSVFTYQSISMSLTLVKDNADLLFKQG